MGRLSFEIAHIPMLVTVPCTVGFFSLRLFPSLNCSAQLVVRNEHIRLQGRTVERVMRIVQKVLQDSGAVNVLAAGRQRHWIFHDRVQQRVTVLIRCLHHVWSAAADAQCPRTQRTSSNKASLSSSTSSAFLYFSVNDRIAASNDDEPAAQHTSGEGRNITQRRHPRAETLHKFGSLGQRFHIRLAACNTMLHKLLKACKVCHGPAHGDEHFLGLEVVLVWIIHLQRKGRGKPREHLKQDMPHPPSTQHRDDPTAW